MSWKKNRRRKRTWYRHYKHVCDRINDLVKHGQLTGNFSADQLAKEFFSLYEQYRLHGCQRLASSAYESLELAIQDTGLDKVSLVPCTSVQQSGSSVVHVILKPHVPPPATTSADPATISEIQE